ncbi:MAG: hypothetical protein ACOCNX_00570 [Prevotella sp.]
MSKKDKFAQLNRKEGVGSFQDTLVRAASTAAAIEKKNEQQRKEAEQQESHQRTTPDGSSPTILHPTPSTQHPTPETTRYTHLPNPLISVREYNLASQYCSTFDNMTRQDWMELAIIEKLYHDKQMPEEEFKQRQKEIRSRLPRGQRKNTKKK